MSHSTLQQDNNEHSNFSSLFSISVRIRLVGGAAGEWGIKFDEDHVYQFTNFK